jgi:hypothetical protein
MLQMRGIHACRWLAAEAQAQAPAVPLSTEPHALDVRAARACSLRAACIARPRGRPVAARARA